MSGEEAVVVDIRVGVVEIVLVLIAQRVFVIVDVGMLPTRRRRSVSVDGGLGGLLRPSLLLLAVASHHAFGRAGNDVV
jgi:hypothetical protein